jgi:hypothetical protein
VLVIGTIFVSNFSVIAYLSLYPHAVGSMGQYRTWRSLCTISDVSW